MASSATTDETAGSADARDPTEIRILHVDDEPDFAQMVADFLEQEGDHFDVTTATTAADGHDLLETQEFDCIVSDQDMPGRTGIEFLQEVREKYPDLPFLLFTGKGSEEVASDAVSAGVSDYLQKGTGTDQYTLLANRIENTVSQYRAERATEEHQQLLDERSTAMEASIDGIAIIDADGCYRFANQAHADVYGYDDPDVFIGEHWTMCYDEATIERFEHEILPDYRDTGSWRGEVTGQRTDGTPFTQELSLTTLNGDNSGTVSVVRDITEQKSREQQLCETTQQLEAILETTTAAIFMKDCDGHYLLVNDEFCNLVGHDDVDAVLGKTDAAFFDEPTADRMAADDARVLEDRVTHEIEETIPTPDGPRDHLTLKSPVDDETGSPYAICGVATDITALKERERDLDRERDRIDTMTSLVSDDLRNPLSVAKDRLERARREDDRTHLAAAERTLDHMEHLLEDILTLTRTGDIVDDPEPVDLPAIADTAWNTLAPTDADVTLDIETNATITADPDRLHQLLTTLFRNAIDHASTTPTHDGAETPPGERSVTVTLGECDDGFYVADDGPGIPVDERSQVWDAGYSTTDHATGFGLAIAKQIATAHRWTITITDSTHDGTRIELTNINTQ